ncbi:MAG: hypothetical protein DRN81_04195, partial [Thermoproteota archaeon]
MVTFKDALGYPLIKAGLLFLILAIVLALISMYEVPKSGIWSGEIKTGEYFISDSNIERNYYINNRTLTIYSQNASLLLIHGNKIDVYNLKNESVVLTPLFQPQINVESGEVKYTYDVKGVDYP